MAYVFQTNLTPATGHDAVFAWKATLVAAGWTVMASGTGTSGSYNAAGDSIVTSANLNAANAWFRLRAPDPGDGVRREYVVQRTTASTTYRIKYSPGAGFTGAPGGGGSTDADTVPSSADERVVVGGGTDASPTGAVILPTDATYRWHVGAGGAADKHAWWAAALPIGGGALSAGWFLEAMLPNTYPSADLDPYAQSFSTTAFNQTSWAGTVVRSVLGSGVYKKGLAGEAWVAFSGCGWAGGNTGGGSVPPTVFVATKIGSSPYNAKDDLMPLMWGRRSAQGSGGYKGMGAMLRLSGVLRTVGDTLTVATSRDRITFGPLVLPWDGSVPTI